MTPLEIVPANDLSFTGERFVPGAGVEITYDHWNRYAFSRQFVSGKRVLDVASGEGYGADFLAQTASQVVGFDADDTAVAHARKKYGQRGNLTFTRSSLASFFKDAPPRSFDVITAFEIVEHVDEDEQRALISGIARLLAPGGLAVFSTPDKHTYTDAKLSTNKFHVRELYPQEFHALIRNDFKHVAMYDQSTFTGSAILLKGAVEAQVRQLEWTHLIELRARLRDAADYAGQYLIAVASADHIPSETRGHIVLDPAMKLIGEEKYALEHEFHELEANRKLVDEEKRALTNSLNELHTNCRLLEVEKQRLESRCDAFQATAKRIEDEKHDLEQVLKELRVRAGSTLEADNRMLRALNTTVDVLSQRIAGLQDLQTRYRRLDIENQAVKADLQFERLHRNHVENMLAVKVAFGLKRQLDRSPRIKELTRRVLFRLLK